MPNTGTRIKNTLRKPKNKQIVYIILKKSVMHKKIFPIFLLLSITLGSCFKMPEYKGVRDVSIDSVKKQNIYITESLLIFNPNNFNITTTNIDYVIAYNNVQFASGTVVKGFNLVKKKTTSIPTKIVINSDSLMSAIKNSDISTDTFVFDVNYKILLNKKKNAISFKDKIYLSKQLLLDNLINNLDIENIFEIKSIKIKSFTPFATTLTIVTTFKNKYPIEFDLTDLDLSVLNNSDTSEELSKINIDSSVTIKAFSEKDVAVDVNLNNINTGKTVIQGFGSLNLLIKGKSKLKINKQEFEIPIELPYQLSLLNSNY